MLDCCITIGKFFVRPKRLVWNHPGYVIKVGEQETDQRMSEAKLLDGEVRNLTMDDIISSLRTPCTAAPKQQLRRSDCRYSTFSISSRAVEAWIGYLIQQKQH
jgi:hypothetical protein